MMLEQLLPIHPKLVHFPIALFITALVFEIIALIIRNEGLRKSAMYLFVTATLMTFVVVRSGIWEQARLHLNHPVLTQHRQYGLWTMWVSLGSMPLLLVTNLVFKKYFRLVFVIVLLAVCGLVGLTAHEGGEMVYEYGVGVEQ